MKKHGILTSPKARWRAKTKRYLATQARRRQLRRIGSRTPRFTPTPWYRRLLDLLLGRG